MSTGYNWEGIRQVRATLLGARHVPERFCGGLVLLGALYQVFDLYLLPYELRCLPDSPKLGLGFRVRVSANRD